MSSSLVLVMQRPSFGIFALGVPHRPSLVMNLTSMRFRKYYVKLIAIFVDPFYKFLPER